MFTDAQIVFIKDFVEYEIDQDKAFCEWEGRDDKGRKIDAYKMAKSILKAIEKGKE